ncbi:hypothetical protein GOBAR_DD16729 [Gossypium barbadense]|nr:hypothetical protein GOBAR_DD16729 [Gossypium barbadense]
MDVELNEVGRQQAASLAERLSRVPEISAIYSSDLKRALETAETIVATCGKFEVIKDPDLRERHLGDVQGLLFRDSQSLSPGLPSIFVSPDRSSYTWRWRKLRPTLSSCYIFITENLSETYRYLLSSRSHPSLRKRVVVVTHGGVIRALYRRACSRRFRGSILNTSVNIIQISGDDVWTIKAWGDIDHLNQTGHSMSGFGVSKTPSVVSPVLT